MVRAPGTEERRVMTRPPIFYFIFGNGLALDQYLDRSDLKYCRGWTQTTSKTMPSTVALKDFYNTWFNSPENKADIEASFRDLANSACPLMHAMAVARCSKLKGCVAILAAVSFRVEQHFCLLEYLLVSDQLFTQRRFGKKANESPFKDVGLGRLLLAFTHIVARASAPPPVAVDASSSVAVDASSSVTSYVFFDHKSEALHHFYFKGGYRLVKGDLGHFWNSESCPMDLHSFADLSFGESGDHVLAVRETSDFCNVPKYQRPHQTLTVFSELFRTIAGLSSTIAMVFCMEYSGRGPTSGFFKCIEELLQSRFREVVSYYDTAKERQKLLESKDKTGNESKKRKRSSKKGKKGKPPPVTVLTRADCRRLNGLYGSRCLVKFKDMGSGSRSTIV
jgi:hypothetical protein